MTELKFSSTIALTAMVDEAGQKHLVAVARRGGENVMVILPIGPCQQVQIERAIDAKLPCA
jgi:hypothetical protein